LKKTKNKKQKNQSMIKIAKVLDCIPLSVSTGQDISLQYPKLDKGYLCLQQCPSPETRLEPFTLLSASYKDN